MGTPFPEFLENHCIVLPHWNNMSQTEQEAQYIVLNLSVGNKASRCFGPDVLLVRGLGKTEC